jgi:molybdate transport system substrate-binding protein
MAALGRRRWLLVLLVVCALGTVTGCAGDGAGSPARDESAGDAPAGDAPAGDAPAGGALDAGGSATPPGGDGQPLTGPLVVFAAASLIDGFEAIAAAFEDAHPDVEVVLNLGGSQSLAAQVREGATADVFASADEVVMATMLADGLVSSAVPFVGNRLEIAVEPGNPAAIGGLADLAHADLVVVVAEASVPAGRYAEEALARAGVELTPASFEVDVRAVLGKVALGEADAGIVYRSDVVTAGGRVEGVPIPPEHNLAATYPIAVLDDAPNRAAGEAFVAFVRSAAGRRLLEASGFEVLP